MKLYYSPSSPFVRKVLIVAHETGAAGRIEIVPYAVNPTATGRVVGMPNPLNKVPALETDGGRVLVGSSVIAQFLLATAAAPAAAGAFLAPEAEADARFATLSREAVADGALDALVLMRFEAALRPEALRWPAWALGQEAKASRALDDLERVHATLPVDVWDLASVAALCALSYIDLRFPEMDWRATRPALARFYDHAHETRDSVKLTMLK